METKEIDLNQIRVSELNTRKDLAAGTEDASVADMANSIREKGLLSPVMVRMAPDGLYEVVAGQRRVLACRQLGMASIPAVVRDDLSDADAVVVSLIENVHRADMNPMDKARAYQAIYAKHESVPLVAKETGVHQSTVRRYLSFVNLAPSIQTKITTTGGFASVETLSVLANTFPTEQQEEVLEQIQGLSTPIQQRIIKESGGDLDKIPELVEHAAEEALNTRWCSEGLCFAMPSELKNRVKLELAAEEANETNN